WPARRKGGAGRGRLLRFNGLADARRRLILPEMICFFRTATFASTCLRSLPVRRGLILPRATPLFFRLKTTFEPPLNLPAFAFLIARKTPLSTRFTALVRMYVPRNDWSWSTP